MKVLKELYQYREFLKTNVKIEMLNSDFLFLIISPPSFKYTKKSFVYYYTLSFYHIWLFCKRKKDEKLLFIIFLFYPIIFIFF